MAGSIVNMALIMIGPYIVAPPEGADVTTAEGLKASMHLFQPVNFLFPFLAHALGTVAGALLTAWIAAGRKMVFALVIGVMFLAAGIANIFMLPSPLGFTLTDLLLAYVPMAWLAGKLIVRKS